MNKKISIIGIIFADEMEYKPFEKAAESFGAVKETFFSKNCLSFNFEDLRIIAVESGIGKVNAAFAASSLILEKNADALHRRNDKAHNDDGKYGENENLPKAEGRVKTEAKSHRCSPPAYVKYIPITLFSGAAQPSSA